MLPNSLLHLHRYMRVLAFRINRQTLTETARGSIGEAEKIEDSSTVDNVDPSTALDTYSESYLTADSEEGSTMRGLDSVEVSESDSDEDGDQFRRVSARPFPLPQLDALNKVTLPPLRLALSFPFWPLRRLRTLRRRRCIS